MESCRAARSAIFLAALAASILALEGPACAQLLDPLRPAPAAPAVEAGQAAANPQAESPSSGPRTDGQARGKARTRTKGRTRTAAERDTTAAPVSGTVTLVSGQPGSATLEMASDLSSALNDGRLRILTLLGAGGARNIADVIGTRGVDMGIVTTVDLRQAEGTEANRRVVTIAKLDNMELHVLARPEIRHLTDLDGRNVNLGEAGSSTEAVAQALLKHFGIRYTPANLGQKEALERMKSGESLAASFYLTGKPAPLYAGIAGASGLHFLPLPYEPSLDALYFPASLEQADYPNLIAKDEKVGSIAVTAALVAFDWDTGSRRYRRLSAFTAAFFEKFEQLRAEGRHPKWREVNLAADLPGWRRFKPAQDILDHRVQATAAPARTETAAE